MRFVDVLTHLHFSFLHIVYHLSTLFEKFLTPQAAGNVPSLIQKCDALADAVSGINRFDLVLFLEPTVSFVQDGTRNEKIAQDREKYSREIKMLFDEAGMEYCCLGGDYLDRFNQAKKLIEEKFRIKTIW